MDSIFNMGVAEFIIFVLKQKGEIFTFNWLLWAFLFKQNQISSQNSTFIPLIEASFWLDKNVKDPLFFLTLPSANQKCVNALL